MASPEYEAAFEAAHRAYAATRWALLSEEDRAWCEAKGYEAVLRDTGGGMRGFTQVRCLHVHTAHALVAGGEANIVGRWVLEALRNGEDAVANDYQKAHEPPTSARARAAATAAPATLPTHTTGTETGTPAGTGTTSAVQARTGTCTCSRPGSTRRACVRAPPTRWWHPVLRVLTAASAHSVLGVL